MEGYEFWAACPSFNVYQAAALIAGGDPREWVARGNQPAGVDAIIQALKEAVHEKSLQVIKIVFSYGGNPYSDGESTPGIDWIKTKVVKEQIHILITDNNIPSNSLSQIIRQKVDQCIEQ